MTQIGSYHTKSEPLTFTIDDHPCEAAGALPVETFIEFVGILGQLGKGADDEGNVGMDGMGRTVGLLSAAVKLCCLPDTAEYITEGLKSNEHPIDLDMLQEILQDIMAAYGMAAKKDDDDDGEVAEEDGSTRPTQPTPDSSTGSESTKDGSEGD